MPCMNNTLKRVSIAKKLADQRAAIARHLPLERMIRGTLMTRYLECIRPHCRCHESKKLRHGPYYFISIRRRNRSMHVYVPLSMRKEAKKWSENYDRVWKGIEAITDLNVKLLRAARKNDR